MVTLLQPGVICTCFDEDKHSGRLCNGTSQIRECRFINMCPAAFRWLLGFNEPKKKLFVHSHAAVNHRYCKNLKKKQVDAGLQQKFIAAAKKSSLLDFTVGNASIAM